MQYETYQDQMKQLKNMPYKEAMKILLCQPPNKTKYRAICTNGFSFVFYSESLNATPEDAYELMPGLVNRLGVFEGMKVEPLLF